MPAGSNARASRATARAKNQSADSGASSPSLAVPKEVVTRLYKHGRLILTVPTKSKPSEPLCEGLIYSDNDEKDLDAVDNDADYINKNFTSFPPPATASCNRVIGGPQRPDTSKMSQRDEKKALKKFERDRTQWLDSLWKKVAKDTFDANLTSSPQQWQSVSYHPIDDGC